MSLDIAHWILLAVAVVCWLEKRRERRQADENAAAMRARMEFHRVSCDSFRGKP